MQFILYKLCILCAYSVSIIQVYLVCFNWLIVFHSVPK